jgi:ethanolamine transporter EutH
VYATSDTGLGKEFMEGIHSTGYIFVPASGIMASLPYISWFVEKAVSPLFHQIGADPAIAATAILASDMGDYQLADILKSSLEGWMIAIGLAYWLSVPKALELEKLDRAAGIIGPDEYLDKPQTATNTEVAATKE